MKRFLGLAICFCLTSCGYRLVSSQDQKIAFTIRSIPGDTDGLFLQTLIKTSEAFSSLKYRPFSAPLHLQVKMIGIETDHIGFRYQTEDGSGAVIHRLSPTEGQHRCIVEVAVYDANYKPKLTPRVLEASIEYDFVDSKSYHDLTFTDSAGQLQTVLNYSLGQLDSEEAATLGSKERLYQKLSEEILSYLLVAL